jgi:hypothetical protein
VRPQALQGDAGGFADKEPDVGHNVYIYAKRVANVHAG